MSTSEMNQSRNLADIIKKWFLNCPSHGIQRIGQAETFIIGFVWAYSFWIFLILMACSINIVIYKHIDHPTKIHLTVQQDRNPQHFPAITFCNIVSLKNDGFLDDFKKPQLEVPNSSRSVPTTEDDEQIYRKAVTEYMQRILVDQVSGQKHPFVRWGFQLDDLLITCIFNKKRCNENLQQIFHPDYGNCYTFDNELHVRNEEFNDTRQDWVLNNDNDDEEYKLFLEFYLHQKEYNQYLDNRAAMRIFIHRKHEIPILSQTSLVIEPKKYTKISFLPRVKSFIQQCRNNLTNYMNDFFSNQTVRYTQALCYKLCEHRFIVEQCKCIDPRFAVFYQYFNNNNTNRSTTTINLCPMDCICLQTRAPFNKSELCSECLSECELIQYSVQSSYASYPNIQAREKVLRRVKVHFHNRNISTDLNTIDSFSNNHRTNLENNLVAIEISASPYATEILTESLVYTWGDLISSIGGQTCLWIGVSLIGFVEIFELIYLLIDRFCIYPYFWKEKTNKQTSSIN